MLDAISEFLHLICIHTYSSTVRLSSLWNHSFVVVGPFSMFVHHCKNSIHELERLAVAKVTLALDDLDETFLVKEDPLEITPGLKL